MTGHSFDLAGAALEARASGALHWPARRLLVVSDLHLGKSTRVATQGGALLPPYETRATLERLSEDIAATDPAQVICLGDSFDRAALDAALPEDEKLWIARLQAGRDWTWIEGNHDPGPVSLGGAHRADLRLGPLVFRHIASGAGGGEVSGHYHPKATLGARGRRITAPCFLLDRARLILPAYGAYTGGLACTAPVLQDLMAPEAVAILTGTRARAIPMTRVPR